MSSPDTVSFFTATIPPPHRSAFERLESLEKQMEGILGWVELTTKKMDTLICDLESLKEFANKVDYLVSEKGPLNQLVAVVSQNKVDIENTLLMQEGMATLLLPRVVLNPLVLKTNTARIENKEANEVPLINPIFDEFLQQGDIGMQMDGIDQTLFVTAANYNHAKKELVNFLAMSFGRTKRIRDEIQAAMEEAKKKQEEQEPDEVDEAIAASQAKLKADFDAAQRADGETQTEDDDAKSTQTVDDDESDDDGYTEDDYEGCAP